MMQYVFANHTILYYIIYISICLIVCRFVNMCLHACAQYTMKFEQWQGEVGFSFKQSKTKWLLNNEMIQQTKKETKGISKL